MPQPWIRVWLASPPIEGTGRYGTAMLGRVSRFPRLVEAVYLLVLLLAASATELYLASGIIGGI